MPMICSSMNPDLFILSVSFVGTDSASNWRRKQVSGQRKNPVAGHNSSLQVKIFV
jgi:hypothetical protein